MFLTHPEFTKIKFPSQFFSPFKCVKKYFYAHHASQIYQSRNAHDKKKGGKEDKIFYHSIFCRWKFWWW